MPHKEIKVKLVLNLNGQEMFSAVEMINNIHGHIFDTLQGNNYD